MKKHLFIAALALAPIMAPTISMSEERPEGGVINDLKSDIRDDYRQLNEDRDAGFTQAVRDDERQLAEDKMRLREAQAHPEKKVPPRAPRTTHLKDDKAHDVNGDQVNAAPPPPEHDEWRNTTDKVDKIDPDRTFNHSAHVDNEIR